MNLWKAGTWHSNSISHEEPALPSLLRALAPTAFMRCEAGFGPQLAADATGGPAD